MEKLFFDSWESIIRTSVIGFFSYAGLLLMLRVSGSRTLSQLNAFDLIVTVALGSMLSSVMLSKDVALLDGLTAIAILILLQFITAFALVRWKRTRKFILTDPVMLFYKGRYLTQVLMRHRITEKEILQIVRSSGISDMNEIEAVVLESNGQFSVINKRDKLKTDQSTLSNVEAQAQDLKHSDGQKT